MKVSWTYQPTKLVPDGYFGGDTRINDGEPETYTGDVVGYVAVHDVIHAVVVQDQSLINMAIDELTVVEA